ncbi:Oligosaccharide biosynthesis protein Alg14-like [Babesia duncani]|uniref:UDP-N-acetylglucosamine transferase subunit ALG14 n=1 Tax=Babesia duncani TaxID=323732 RepID=A0AAD9PLQ9_9APIC|nr:Oligosaccharide biosynthesis protein Alg14-like [Babesia duncani]
MPYFMVIVVYFVIILTIKWFYKRQTGGKTAITVVLGSGGHTREMIEILNTLEFEHVEFDFISGTRDFFSKNLISTLFTHPWITRIPCDLKDDILESRIYKIPPPRAFGCFIIESILTTIYSSILSLFILFKLQPNLILSNGPGIAVPVCYTARILRFIGLINCKIAYIESFARVTSLSLTGKFLYHVVDEFIVMWPQLKEQYPQAKYYGTISCIN